MGVTIKCNCEVGNALSVEQLKAEYRAVLVTLYVLRLNIASFEKANHAEIAVDFLQRARQTSGDITVAKSVLIIGGGDVAMDVASTLKLLAARQSLVSRVKNWLIFRPAIKNSAAPSIRRVDY